MAKSFTVFPIGNWFSKFLAAIDLLLLTDTENCSRRLIATIDTIMASLFPLSDDWLSAISYLQWEPHVN
jgi:hypothetical protein